MIKSQSNSRGKLCKCTLMFCLTAAHWGRGEPAERWYHSESSVWATGAPGLQKGTGMEGQSRNWSPWGEEVEFPLLDMMQRKP